MQWSNQYNRLVPEIGPEHYKSYSLAAPLETHWKNATCEEYECDEFVYGFVLTVDISTQMGERQYDYITHDRSRKYSMQKVDATVFKFVYGPGNEGFGAKHGEHKVGLGRTPLLLVEEGDFRGNPRGTPARVHVREQDWAEDFALHVDKLNTAIQRG